MSDRVSSDELTVRDAVAYWLDVKRHEVRASTMRGYRQIGRNIVGPLLAGNKVERIAYGRYGRKRSDARFITLLGDERVADLTTAHIRKWYQTIHENVDRDVAMRAKKQLGAVLALIEEEYELRVPRLPRRTCSSRSRERERAILRPEQVARLLVSAETDARGIYYTFPFFTGTRPSEQLGLLWDDINFKSSVILIRRTLQQDRTLVELVKSAASVREIPIPPPLENALQRWQSECPSRSGWPRYVFPCLGNGNPAYKKRGQPLGYVSYIRNYWARGLARSGLPYVTPHTARHTFISTLQARGVEVGLVAKLAGHANPNVTLAHYTMAVRGGYEAVALLADAYRETWR